jgi:hypothetical protein
MYTPRFAAAGVVKLLGYAPLIVPGQSTCPVILWSVQELPLRGARIMDNNVVIDANTFAWFPNHYSFHIIDPDWGHIIIKLCGHPPFGAQIILNGHEYVARQAKKESLDFKGG